LLNYRKSRQEKLAHPIPARPGIAPSDRLTRESLLQIDPRGCLDTLTKEGMSRAPDYSWALIVAGRVVKFIRAQNLSRPDSWERVLERLNFNEEVRVASTCSSVGSRRQVIR
jgi:hypothetical protein